MVWTFGGKKLTASDCGLFCFPAHPRSSKIKMYQIALKRVKYFHILGDDVMASMPSGGVQCYVMRCYDCPTNP